MSVLTKIFVGLLVLLSVAFTAGVVTFINKLQPLVTANSTLTKQVATAEDRARALQGLADAAQGSIDQSNRDHTAEISKLNLQLANARETLNDRDMAVAKLNTDKAMQSSDLTRLTAALTASEQTTSSYADQLAAARKVLDDRQTKLIESSNQISKLTRDLSVTERERRNLDEQLTQAKETMGKQASILKDNDLSVADAGGLRGGAPDLTGVIRSRTNIAGREYATISLGSEDSVAKGMEFNILEKGTGRFLGKLKVEVVDSSEAFGQISSDDVASVQPGAEVKTQL